MQYERQNSNIFISFLFGISSMADHISRMLCSSTWGTQVEILAAAPLFQVPIYECVQSANSYSYHWEVHHPVVETMSSHQVILAKDSLLQNTRIPSHFELFYETNLHYDCVIDKTRVKTPWPFHPLFTALITIRK